MRDGTLITTGIIGAAAAAICCATPLLALVLSAAGLSAWLAKADYVLIPVLILGAGLLALGFYRRRLRTRLGQECGNGGSLPADESDAEPSPARQITWGNIP